MQLSKDIPDKKHVVALVDRIVTYRNGEIIDEVKQTTKQYINGKKVKKEDWQIFTLNIRNKKPIP